jgi:hypothetical protein
MWFMPPGTVPAILARVTVEVQVFLRGMMTMMMMIIVVVMKAVRVLDANMLGMICPRVT